MNEKMTDTFNNTQQSATDNEREVSKEKEPHFVRSKKGNRLLGGVSAAINAFFVIFAVIGLAALVLWLKGYLGFIKPVSNESTTVTFYQVQSKLSSIGELATYMDEYSGEKEATNDRKLLGKHLPGTTNSYRIVYRGVIKVGYEVDEIRCRVDNEAKTIYVSLPSAQILDNYIVFDDLELVDQKNNLLNPFDFDDFREGFKEIEEAELKKAKEEGIMVHAEDSAKMIIQNALASFNEYDVVFTK